MDFKENLNSFATNLVTSNYIVSVMDYGSLNQIPCHGSLHVSIMGRMTSEVRAPVSMTSKSKLNTLLPFPDFFCT